MDKQNFARINTATVGEDGFLRVNARLARIGTYDYGDQYELVPESELEKVAADYKSRAVTVEHSNGMVKKGNTTNYGLCTDAYYDAESGWVIGELTITDERAIEMALSTHGQISVGYYCDMDDTPGVFHDTKGVMGRMNSNDEYEYAASQINIRPNHVTLCKQARAGSDCKILNTNDNSIGSVYRANSINVVKESDEKETSDSSNKNIEKIMTKIKINGLSYTVEGKDAENIVTLIEGLQAQLAEVEAAKTNSVELQSQVAELTAALDAQTKLNSELLCQEDVANEVQSRLNAWTVAKKVLNTDEIDVTLNEQQIKDLVWEHVASQPSSASAQNEASETVEETSEASAETKVETVEEQEDEDATKAKENAVAAEIAGSTRENAAATTLDAARKNYLSRRGFKRNK